MATNWEAKFGKGKWVTIRGAHVYVQEGAGLRSALSKLNGSKKKIMSPVRKAPKMSDGEKRIIGKVRSPIYAGESKLKLASNPIGKGKLTTNAIGKNRLEKNFEGIKVKRNEDIIKRYNKANPSKMDWGEYTKLDDAARIARDENRKLKAKNEPGRGQTVSDYRNPQFKKGDHYSPVGKSHVTARVYPDASKTGAADQELNELYAQRIPHGNRTYTDKMIKGSWEGEVKKVLKNAQAARKANGTEGKLRSDVYKDSPQQVAEKKARANKELKDSIFRQATAKATVNAEAIKKREDARKATAAANASAELKKLKNTPVKEEDENARLKRQIFLEATAAQKPAQKTKTTSNPVQGRTSGSFSAKDAMGKLNKLATTLNNGGGHPFDDWRQARDILEKAPVGTTITAHLNRGTKSVHIKKADGKWTNDSGAPYDTNTMSKYWYKGNNDIPEVDIYTPEVGRGGTRTPTLKEALKEKAGKKTRKK